MDAQDFVNKFHELSRELEAVEAIKNYIVNNFSCWNVIDKQKDFWVIEDIYNNILEIHYNPSWNSILVKQEDKHAKKNIR